MPARISEKKELANLHFTNIGDAKFECRYGTERKHSGNAGFTILMGHIQLQDPNWENEIDTVQLTNFCASRKGVNLYNGPEIVVFGDEPFSFYSSETPIVRRFFEHVPYNVKPLSTKCGNCSFTQFRNRSSQNMNNQSMSMSDDERNKQAYLHILSRWK